MDIIYTIWLRSMKRYVRSKSRIVGSIAMPLFLLVFLGFGLNSVVSTASLGQELRDVSRTRHGCHERALYLGLLRHPDHLGQTVRVFKRDPCGAGIRLEIMFGQTVGGATTAVIQGFIIMVLAVILGLKITEPVWVP